MRRKKKNRQKHPTLSLCMIVKNEEQYIEQCLESVKPCVGEIVVVDTGSTDKTVDIALAHGAKVYHHPWEDDFSKHQNQSVDYATGNWILQMDGDEALDKSGCRMLREVIKESEADAFLVSIHSYFNQGTSCSRESKIRLFRNRSSIRYEGIVHKQLRGYRYPKVSPLIIHHFGYDLKPGAMKKKSARTIALLMKQIEAEPDNYWHRHNLAVCYATDFCFKEAMDTAEKALALAHKQESQNHNLLWTYYVLSSAAFKLNDLAAAEKYANAAIHRSADHLDSYFLLTLIYHVQKRWDELETAANNYISTLNHLNRSPERFMHMMIHSANELWRIKLALADFHLHRGDETSAETELQAAISQTPIKCQCYRLISNIYRENGNLDLAEAYCQKAWDTGDRGVEYQMSRAKIQEQKGDQKAYFNTLNKIKKMDIDQVEILAEVGKADLISGCYSDAASVFERIIDISGPDHDALINLSLAYKYTDRQDDAIRCNKHALEIQSNSLHALTNLGHLYFETGDVDNAIAVYQRAHDMEPDALDVSLRLASSYLYQGKANECVALCDRLLEKLQMPRNITLSRKEDLALIFGLIGTGLDNVGSRQLAREAIKIAAELDPAFIENFEKDPHEIQTTLNLIDSETKHPGFH